ncbi:TPR-like protein [Saccharata proteae CBS 121410]|uniref:TPR-like protein n=1 Tax=Saccharata proteae CBS 121410 TaxID=1314787 RepID=A0A9P4I0Q8_9PEZI|nr:TPR-like protein [Saccharata proteae CBS 121410]
MEKFLRDWRQDALNKHQYDSAIFIGDKLLAISNNDKDAFWLAQVHFSTGNYARAQATIAAFLSKPDIAASPPSCRYLSAHCSVKLGRYEEALTILGDKNPVHLITAPDNSRKKIQHLEVDRRNGSSRHKSGLRSDRVDRSEERDREGITNIKAEACMCYLRGLCYAKQNAFDRAKECYKDAVRIDVQCFEAFDQLMKNSLMSPEEEWQFLDSLDFESVHASDVSSAQEAAEFTKMLYITRLSKYEKPEVFTAAIETLSTHYNLASNPDILLSKAEQLFTQCRFHDALNLTNTILSKDKYNFSTLPVHLACLHELNARNDLFLLSHDLADNQPDQAVSWLAIGIYYLTISRIADARRFFSKASMMDPHFGPAWIGFAHTFAAEGEHDQAISAYSTAARLFQGTHLPQLFLGMQNLQLGNLALAHEYLDTAYGLCKSDPLLMNELGVVFYHENHLVDAIQIFNMALDLSEKQSLPRHSPARLATLANLGHAHRRSRDFPAALQCFDDVLRHGGKDAGVFCAKGLVLMEMSRCWDAVVVLHEALSVAPQDPIGTDLLGRALEGVEGVDGALRGGGGGEVLGEDEEVERRVVAAKREVAARRGFGSRRRKRAAMMQEAESMVLDEGESEMT